jgi:hypothetical protein
MVPSRRGHRVGLLAWALPCALHGCLPSGNLDVHGRGSASATAPEPAATPAPGGVTPAEGTTPDAPGVASSPSETTNVGMAPLVTVEPAVAQSDAGSGPVAADAGLALDAGAPGTPPGTVVEQPPAPPPFAPALPDDLQNAPVSGEIVFSDEAEWEVDGVFEPTFEIHTPTASYWIAKPLGTMVSMEDRAAAPEQWIAFSSGFRPLRGVPALQEPPATRFTTVRDEDSQTPTHVRLTSVSLDGEWQWVWDFYVTHVTFTVNRAPGNIAFNYRGVPGGSLGQEDQLVLSDGTAQGARNSFSGELPGPSEWAYLADTTLGRSLFMIQHTDDALAERYQVRDNDSAFFTFGNGLITTLPQRFSLGLIPSTSHATVTGRAEFVIGAISGR